MLRGCEGGKSEKRLEATHWGQHSAIAPFGDWLEYSALRFRQLFPDKTDAYTDEKVRQILREIMPSLERYRFLRKVRPSADESVGESETIYEALPAMWHYQANQLVESVTFEENPA